MERIRTVLGVGMLAIVTLAASIGGTGRPVSARCYGGRNYSTPKRCSASCTKGLAAIRGCAVQARKAALASCRKQLQSVKLDCSGHRACVKRFLKACTGSAKGATSRDLRYAGKAATKCRRCCSRSCGSLACGAAFEASRWYGAYNYHGLHCPAVDSDVVSSRMSDRVRHGLSRLVPFAVDGWTSASPTN